MDCFCSKPRSVHCKIILLDEQELIHEVQDACTGQTILDVVFRHLNLLETAYFGLRYLDQNSQTHWLDPAKKLNKQFKGTDPYTLYFGVKFYAADPCKLLEEITRYQFFLQGKQDILQGRLPVSFELASELGAYVVQSELGDYDPRRHSPGYVSEFRFVSNQTVELENRIAELHKTLVGQLPSVAELNYLDKIKWLEMYGVDLHPVVGENNVEYFLGLTPSGIIVLRNKNTVGNYYWPRISKIYFKGRYFMLRVTDKNNDENTFGFETPSKPACKHLWKCCVEHHAFFRLVQNTPSAPDIFAHTPSIRYRGREEKHCLEEIQNKIRPPPTFARLPSRRYQRRNLDNSPIQVAESIAVPFQLQELKHVSFPQPAQVVENSYRTCSNGVATTTTRHHRSDSPRSTRSAPWSQPHSKGLYNNNNNNNNSTPPSPRSVRSAGHRYRSSSIDSQSSTDSRFYKRRKRRSRMNSDNDSELSKGSEKSHRKHRRHRSRGHKGESGSEADSHSHRRKSNVDSKLSLSHYELVDSCSQWLEVQRKQAEAGVSSSIHLANVISSGNRASYPAGGSEYENSHVRNRRHRKRRSHSRSPSDAWLPEEFKKHLEFELVDTTGMSEMQLKEIPYTVIRTNNGNKQPKMKYLLRTKNEYGKPTNSPPPPYSQEVTYADRFCDSRLKFDAAQNSGSDLLPKNSPSMNNSNLQNNPTKYLSSMLESLGISQKYSRQSAMNGDRSFENPGLLYAGMSNGFPDSLNGFNVSHEHTDSGLGADQECTCGSDRYPPPSSIN